MDDNDLLTLVTQGIKLKDVEPENVRGTPSYSGIQLTEGQQEAKDQAAEAQVDNISVPTTIGEAVSMQIDSLKDDIKSTAIYRNIFGNDAPDETRLANSEKLGGALGISPQILASNSKMYDTALIQYDRQRNAAFLDNKPFTPTTLSDMYPELDMDDPVAVTMALKDSNAVLKGRTTIAAMSGLPALIASGISDEAAFIKDNWNAGRDIDEASNIKYDLYTGNIDLDTALNKLQEIESRPEMQNEGRGPNYVLGQTIRTNSQMARNIADGLKEIVSTLGPQAAQYINQIALNAGAIGTMGTAATAGAVGLTGTAAAVPIGVAGAAAGIGLGTLGILVGTYKAQVGDNYLQYISEKNPDGTRVFTNTQARAMARRDAALQAVVETGVTNYAYGAVGSVFSMAGRKVAAQEAIKDAGAMKKVIKAGTDAYKESAKKAAAKKAATQFVKATASEVAEEGIQSAISDIDERASGYQGMSYKRMFDDATDAMWQALPAVVGTMLPGSLIHGAGAYVGINRLSQADFDAARAMMERNNEKGMIDRLMEIRDNSSLFKNSPKTYAATVQNQLEKADMGTVYIDAQNAAENPQTHAALNQLVSTGAITEKQLNESITTGKPLEIESGKYMQAATPEMNTALENYRTLDKGERTIHDLQEIRNRAKELRDLVQASQKEREAMASQKILDEHFKGDTEQSREDHATMAELLSGGLTDLKENAKNALDEAIKDWTNKLPSAQEHVEYIHKKQNGQGAGEVRILARENDSQGGQWETARVSSNEGWYGDAWKQKGSMPTQRDILDYDHDQYLKELESSVKPGDAEGEMEIQSITEAKKRVESLERVNDVINSMDKDDLVARTLLDTETYDKAYKPYLAQINAAAKGTKAETAAKESALILSKIAENLKKNYGIPLEKSMAEIVKGGDPTKLNQVAGEHAITAPEGKLRTAASMEENGKSPEEIWKATGWMRGPDHKWRFEIPDNLDKIDFTPAKDGKPHTLGEIYDNPALYEAYPELQGKWVHLESIQGTKDKLVQGSSGYVDDDGHIVIDEGLPADEAKKVLVHEIQHVIQEREGFSGGGNIYKAKEQISDSIDHLLLKLVDLEIKYPEVQKYVDKMDSLSDLLGHYGENDLMGYLAKVKALKAETKAMFKDLKISKEEKKELADIERDMQLLEDAAKQDDYAAYRRLGGEAEAFMTQARADDQTERQRDIDFDKESEARVRRYEDLKKNLSKEELDNLEELGKLEDEVDSYREQPNHDFKELVRKIKEAATARSKIPSQNYVVFESAREAKKEHAHPDRPMPNYDTPYGPAVINFAGKVLPFMASKEMNVEESTIGDFYERLFRDMKAGWKDSSERWTDQNGVTYPGERVHHISKKHGITKADFEEIDKNINLLQCVGISSRKRKGQYGGIPVLALIEGERKCYRVVIEFLNNGRIMFDTALAGKKNDILKNIGTHTAQVLSDKAAANSLGRAVPMSIQTIQKLLGIVKNPDFHQSINLAVNNNYKGKYHGAYDPERNAIELFDGANQSTVIHEGAHMYLSILEKMENLSEEDVRNYFEGDQVKAAAAMQKVKNDLSTIREWAAFSDKHLEEYKGTSLEKEFNKHAEDIRNGVEDAEEVWMQERFARGFEKYLMDGSAPTKETKGVFRRFKSWLTDIYKTAKSLGKVKLTPEIRDIFDRMIATDREIEAWAAQRKLDSIDKAMNVNETEAENFKRWSEEVKEKAKEAALSYYMKTMKSDALENFRKSIGTEENRRDFERKLAEENPLYMIEQLYNSGNQTEADKRELLNMNGLEKKDFLESVKAMGGTTRERWNKHIEEEVQNFQNNILTEQDVRSMAESVLESPEGLQKRSQIEAHLLEKRVNQYIVQVTSSQLKLKRAKDKAKVAMEIKERLGLVSSKEKAEMGRQAERITKDEDKIQKLKERVKKLKDQLKEEKEKSEKAESRNKTSGEVIDRLNGNIKALQDELEKERAKSSEQKDTITDSEATVVDLSSQLEDIVNGLKESRKAMRLDYKLMKDDAASTLGEESVSHATSWKWWENKARIANVRGMKAMEMNDFEEAAYQKQVETQDILMSRMAKENIDEIKHALHGGGKLTTAQYNEEGMDRYGILGILNRIGRKEKPVLMNDDARYFVQHLAYMAGLTNKDGELPLDEKGLSRPFEWKTLTIDLNPDAEMGGPNLGKEIVAPWMKALFDSRNPRKMMDLKMNDLREIFKAIKAVYKIGRREYEGNTLGTSFENAAAKIQDEIMNNWTHDTRTPADKIDSQRTIDRVAEKFHKLVKDITLPEILIERMGKEFYQYVYVPIDKASAVRRQMKQEANKKIQNLFSMYSRKEWTKIRSRKDYMYGYDSMEKKKSWTKEQVICMALNMGTQSNRARLIERVGGNEAQMLDFLDKTLDKRDWDFVEGIWNHVNEYWGERNKIQNDLYGTPMGKVPGLKIQLKNGRTIEGMYYPIKYDRKLAGITNERAANEIAVEDLQGISAFALGMGSTKSREKGSGRQLLRLDLDVYTSHISEAIQHVSMREATVDVYKLLNRKEVVSTLERTIGPEGLNMLRQWVSDNWHSSIIEMSEWNGTLNRLRHNYAFATMGYRVSTALLNVLNIFGMMDRMGAYNALKATADFYFGGGPNAYSNVRDQYRFITQKSTYMKERAANMDRDMALGDKIQVGQNESEVRSLITHGKYGIDKINSGAFKIMAWTDEMFSLPEWMATYKGTMRKLSMEGKLSQEEMNAEAVRLADKAVRETFGSGEVKDQTAFMRRKGPISEMTAFFSYTNLVTNQFIRAGYEMYDHRNIKPLLTATLFWWLLNGFFETCLRELWDDSNDDDKWKKKLAYVMASGGPLGGVPVIRDALPNVANYIMKGGKVQLQDLAPDVPALGALTYLGKALQSTYKGDDLETGRNINKAISRSTPFSLPDTIVDGYWNFLRLMSTDSHTLTEFIYKSAFDKELKEEKGGKK